MNGEIPVFNQRVESTQVGYANGNTLFPTGEVCRNNTGHAETVKVVYNEDVITLKELLNYT